MSSAAFKQGRFIYPEDRKTSPDQGADAHESRTQAGREANLYDAVAGRVAYKGFLQGPAFNSTINDSATLSAGATAVPPEEVLFRRENAPTRDAEDDFYWADKDLSSPDVLPESDLLKTIHSFTADFYNHTTQDRGQGDSRTMDETALLTLGILLEESVSQILGETGDMVFVEGEPINDLELPKSEDSHQNLTPAPHTPKKVRMRKKRKLDHDGTVASVKADTVDQNNEIQ